MKKINKLISVWMFLFSAIILTIALSSFVQANQVDVNFPKVIELNNSPVTKELIITNLSSQSETYNLEVFSTPFTSEINPSSFELDAGAFKKITLTINPKDTNLTEQYIVNIKINVNNQDIYYDFLIIQKKSSLESQDENKSAFLPSNVKNGLSNFTAYFSFANLERILNSIVFQLILVLILVSLVLSFSTRYLKIVNKRG